MNCSTQSLALLVCLSACGSPTKTGGKDASVSTDAQVTLDALGSDADATVNVVDGGATDSAGGTTDAAGGGDGGGGPASDHLLISEVSTTPTSQGVLGIWNPTNAAIALDDYYISDNAVYYGIASGTTWNPPTSNVGTDFLVRFPAGKSIAPGQVLVVALNKSFEKTFSRCPI